VLTDYIPWNSGAYISIRKNDNINMVMHSSDKIGDDLGVWGKKEKGTTYAGE
jgi:hypothetical protein